MRGGRLDWESGEVGRVWVELGMTPPLLPSLKVGVINHTPGRTHQKLPSYHPVKVSEKK